nr:hypothetical protein [Lachnospiraceae bacterium]
MYSNKLLSLKQLCDQLSVSVATGRNWIRLGKIVPEYTEGKIHYFSESYVSALRDELLSGRNPALKSRRNKKYVSGNAFYGSYVSENCKNLPIIQKFELTPEEIQLV